MSGPAAAARPTIIGELPYYRADPANWRRCVEGIARLGVDVVSFYVPWRLHEIPVGESFAYDFDGATDPQRDVAGLGRLIAEHGLLALVKPGPFIHAEVQYGGLPDRVMASSARRYQGLDGSSLRSQGSELPSFAPDTAFAHESRLWLREVAARLVEPLRAQGALYGVQIGNEGVCGDAALPLAKTDIGGLAADRADAGEALRHGTPEGKRRWALAAPAAIVEPWAWIAEAFADSPRRFVNIPLASVANAENALAGWANRLPAFAGTGYALGRTEWIGNPSSDVDAFASVLVGSMLGPRGVLESNWGFTWGDDSYAEDGPSLFSAMLSLLLGADTLSFYTVCSTEHWHPDIVMDEEGIRLDGMRPEDHLPPYCPGAPLREDGGPGRTFASARRLVEFVHEHGSRFAGSELVSDATVEIPHDAIVDDAWNPAAQSLLHKLATAVRDRLFGAGSLVSLRVADGRAAQGQSEEAVHELLAEVPDRPFEAGQSVAMLERRSADGATRILGVFNPSPAEATATHTLLGPDTLAVPAHSARIVVCEHGKRLADFIS